MKKEYLLCTCTSDRAPALYYYTKFVVDMMIIIAIFNQLVDTNFSKVEESKLWALEYFLALREDDRETMSFPFWKFV